MPNYHVGNVKLGNRIAELRVKSKLKQSDLAVKLSEMSKRKTLLQTATISSWETGRRNPASEYIGYLSQLFNVSQAYILGLTDDPNSEDPDNTVSDSDMSNTQSVLTKQLDPSSLFMFDKKPVYVTFKDKKHLDQWGIYDAETDQFVMSKFVIKSSAKSVDAIYSFAPYVISSRSRIINRIDTLQNSNQIYVKMVSRDKEVTDLYDGWYSNNENKTMLINQLGLTLPYSGLNISYCAFLP